tara:strand:+ start:706 stop:2613 length:1908 start_codon:yes stop_codon:yes gene_type:complete
MAKYNKKSPYNPQSDLFKALTRLFSGPITQRRTQTGRQLKRKQMDMYASRFKSASGKQFKKHEYNPINNITMNMISNRNRSERYVDFDEMEYVPEIASSLDIYADEMTTHTDIRPMLNIKCANEEIKHILQNLYHNIMNIEHNLFGWARTMCKYGDFFLYLDIDDQLGIRAVIGLPPQEIERLEGEDQSNPNYVQYQWNTAALTLENWQVAHFRILGNDKHAPYGTSVLEPSRRIYRQLILLEDAMMAYRIVRAPERRVFKIDVGGIPPQEVEQYMQKVMTQMKRHQVVDPQTGKVDLRYNPMSVEEDYYIPIRGGQSSTDIVSLPGAAFNGGIDDVKYLRDKLFSALKVPQSYLTMGEGASEDKTTLAQKDIRFARTIQRLQRTAISELEKVGIIHLYTLGYREDDLLSFKLHLNNPSKIAELQELEHWKQKFDIAATATEGYFSKRWIAENLLGMSEDEFLRNQREMFFDKKYSAKLEAATAGGEAAEGDAGGGGLAGGLGDLGGAEGDLGGDLDLGGEGEDFAGETGGDEGGDTDLLAEPPPANREDGFIAPPRLFAKAKKGGVSKHIANVAKGGEHGTTKRTKFPGAYGYGSLNTMYEQLEQEEDKIFAVSRDIEVLLEGLFKKENQDETQ